MIMPEEYAKMSDDALFQKIQKGLFVDEAVCDGQYHHKRLAEYLERAVYVCPFCGLSRFESNKDILRCRQCGREIRYLPTKELQGIGFDFPFRFVADWYDAQKDHINALNVLEYEEKQLYAERVDWYEVIPYKKKKLICRQAVLSLYGTRAEIAGSGGKEVFPFGQTLAITVLGRNKLNIYSGDKIYQIKGGKRFNALKYVHFFHRYKNITSGDNNGKFLGL